MPSVYKETAPIEVKVKKVEALMRDLGISVSWTCNGHKVTDHESGQVGFIRDTTTPDAPSSFPRTFDTERLVLPES
jgi:hypothetical protein